jgi:N6-adenosine-specific RNA methylase IME4
MTGGFNVIVIDPPWTVSDEGDVNQFGRANPHYATMPFAEILKLPVKNIAAADCHLYLWITNRSLPKGFELIEKWDFRYVTCLTWCKPSFGIGNYFRGSTEHMLFAVRGSRELKRFGSWFAAKRGKNGHSSKPSEMYQLIESYSSGRWCGGEEAAA